MPVRAWRFKSSHPHRTASGSGALDSSALGIFDWQTFLLTIGVIAFANGTLTAIAIFADDVQSRLYRVQDVARLLLLAPLDLLLYRPILVWSRLKGTWRFLRRDKGWYKFERNARPA